MNTDLATTPIMVDAAEPVADNALTTEERDTLTHLEREIAREGASGLRLGQYLTAIRDGRLYREAATTFEKYVKAQLGISRQHADRHIKYAALVAELEQASGNVTKLVTPPEGVLRPLVAIPSKERRAALDFLVAHTTGRVRAADVVQAISYAAPTYTPKRGERTFDPSRRVLPNTLEDLARQLADRLADVPADDRRLVVKRSWVLVARRQRRAR